MVDLMQAESPQQSRAPAPIVQIGKSLRDRAQRQVEDEKVRKFRPLVYWYLTFRCNLACEHCSVQSSPWVDNSDDLTTEECMGVIDQMSELNVRCAILTGGEFLIRPDALQILRALGEKKIFASVESNGLRIDKPFLKIARELQDRGLFGLAISLDGGTRETHELLRGPRSFDRTVRGLRALKEAGIGFTVQCVLNNGNLHTIPDLYRLAEELYPECYMVQWPVLNPIGRGVELVKKLGLRPENINRMFETLRDHRHLYSGQNRVKVPPAMVPPRFLGLVLKDADMSCTTTCDFPLLGVLPNGDVSICALSRDKEDLHFGNLRNPEMRLEAIWSNTRMDMLRSEYLAADHLSGICGDCVWKYTCKGSCRAWAYEEGNSFDAPLPICQVMEEAGAFPKTYKLSLQNAAVAQRFQKMQIGCGCG